MGRYPWRVGMAGGARQVRRRPRADPVRLSSPGIEHAPRGGIRIRQYSQRRAVPKLSAPNRFELVSRDPLAHLSWPCRLRESDQGAQIQRCCRQLHPEDLLGEAGNLESRHPGLQSNQSVAQVLLKTQIGRPASSEVQPPLKSLRYNLFAQAAYLTTQSRQSILKLTSAM